MPCCCRPSGDCDLWGARAGGCQQCLYACPGALKQLTEQPRDWSFPVACSQMLWVGGDRDRPLPRLRALAWGQQKRTCPLAAGHVGASAHPSCGCPGFAHHNAAGHEAVVHQSRGPLGILLSLPSRLPKRPRTSPMLSHGIPVGCILRVASALLTELTLRGPPRRCGTRLRTAGLHAEAGSCRRSPRCPGHAWFSCMSPPPRERDSAWPASSKGGGPRWAGSGGEGTGGCSSRGH